MYVKYTLSPRHPLVAKPLDERRNRYKLKKHVMSVPAAPTAFGP